MAVKASHSQTHKKPKINFSRLYKVPTKNFKNQVVSPSLKTVARATQAKVKKSIDKFQQQISA